MLCASPSADERILSFDEPVTVQPDGTLEGARSHPRARGGPEHPPRHLPRFPTIYPRLTGGRWSSVSASSPPLAMANEPWRTEQVGNGVRIYLGSASVMLPQGEHTYELVYRTDRQMGFFADHDELYWNVTGNGWGFPIDRVSATVAAPAEIPADDIRLEAYTGPQGAKDQNYTATSTTEDLCSRPRVSSNLVKGLTIVAMWPKGFITAAVENRCPPAPVPPRVRAITTRGCRQRVSIWALAHRRNSQSRSAENHASSLPRRLRTRRVALLLLPHVGEGRP